MKNVNVNDGMYNTLLVVLQFLIPNEYKRAIINNAEFYYFLPLNILFCINGQSNTEQRQYLTKLDDLHVKICNL